MNNACFGKIWKDSTDPESSFNTTNNNVPRLRKKKLKITEFLKIGKEFNIFSEYKISCKKKIKRVKLLKESACRKIAERAKTVMLVEMERERETAWES